MINKLNSKRVLLLSLGLLVSSSSFSALKPSIRAPVSNNFLFIENMIDREYFITPESLDPRFSGSNIWTKFASRQTSLGYMGYVGWTANNRNVDMWLDNALIHSPFQGLRCVQGGGSSAQCPAQGFFAPQYMDQYGFYKVTARSGIYNGGYGFASFSPNAYEFMRSARVGSTTTLGLNYCSTEDNYNPARGERCSTHATRGNWYKANFNLTKTAHITLEDTRGAGEIWIDSNGNPSLIDQNRYCKIGIVGRDSGIICQMVQYDYQQSGGIPSGLRFNLIVDETATRFRPAATTIKISGDNGASWYNYSRTANRARDIFKSGRGHISVFFSNTFLKNLVVNRGSIQGQNDVFTFNFDNSNTPESGYYQFSSSTKVNIIPREYAISIQPEEHSKGQMNGQIGSKKPIEFDYKVTLSAPRMANTVTAQVTGNRATRNGLNYCRFSPTNQSYNVLIPAYLSYTNQRNSTTRIRNSCGDSAVSIRDAAWAVLPWDRQQSGSFYTTALKLSFPMDDDASTSTQAGRSWEGTVFAEGLIEVKALWIGVNRN